MYIASNQLEVLPNAIKKLANLEHLDVSHNKLVQINQINCMPKLRVLNISGNRSLHKLPAELATCDSLVDIVLDAEYIVYPAIEILERGTVEILKYLLEDGGISDTQPSPLPVSDAKEKLKRSTINFLENERGSKAMCISKETATDKFLRERVFELMR